MMGQPLKNLSVEQIVECDGMHDSVSANTTNADCGVFGGWPYLAYQYVKKAVSESFYSYTHTIYKPITRLQILDSSKLKKFADVNFKFDENGRKLSKWEKKTLWEKEKLLVTSNFSFSHRVFKRLVSQGRQKVSLCGNGLGL